MKVSDLQNILKTLPPETEIYIRDADTDWVLEVQRIIKGKKTIYIHGDYNLQHGEEEYHDEAYSSKEYLYNIGKEEFLQKTKKWYSEEEYERRKNWKWD